MLAGTAIEVKSFLRQNNNEGLYSLSTRIDLKRELMRMYPKLFETKRMITQPDGTVLEENFLDLRARLSPEEVIEIIRKNRRKIDL